MPPKSHIVKTEHYSIERWNLNTLNIGEIVHYAAATAEDILTMASATIENRQWSEPLSAKGRHRRAKGLTIMRW